MLLHQYSYGEDRVSSTWSNEYLLLENRQKSYNQAHSISQCAKKSTLTHPTDPFHNFFLQFFLDIILGYRWVDLSTHFCHMDILKKWHFFHQTPYCNSVSTQPIAASSGWNHRYAPSGDMPHAVSSRQHCWCNHRLFCYILLKCSSRIKLIKRLFYRFILNPVNAPLPGPFRRGYPRLIGRIYKCRRRGKRHHHAGDVCGIFVLG